MLGSTYFDGANERRKDDFDERKLKSRLAEKSDPREERQRDGFTWKLEKTFNPNV